MTIQLEKGATIILSKNLEPKRLVSQSCGAWERCDNHFVDKVIFLPLIVIGCGIREKTIFK